MKIETKISNFEKMGIGLFVHWGLYSKFAKGEWSQNILNIPTYQAAFNEFNPKEENIRSLVRLAKKCGFKYIVLTAKHHDGFYLFDTKNINNFDSVHTPFHKDVIKIFTDECHRQKIAPFIYYATYDWNNVKYRDDFNGYLAEMRQLNFYALITAKLVVSGSMVIGISHMQIGKKICFTKKSGNYNLMPLLPIIPD